MSFEFKGRFTHKESERVVTELRYDDDVGRFNHVKKYPWQEIP